jgi:predicted MPP superfamily phosphohydrolase
MPPGMALDLGILLVAFAGHVAMGVAFFNQMNSAWLPPHWVHRLERMTMLFTAVIPFGLAFALIIIPSSARDAGQLLPRVVGASPWSWIWLYLAPCGLFGLLSAGRWVRNRWLYRVPKSLISKRTLLRDRPNLAPNDLLLRGAAALAAAIPGNESLEIRVEEKVFSLARWPPELDSFRIAHLSDLHINGRIGRRYFRRAVQLVNDLRPEMVVISGDICERDDCLDWLDEFGAIVAKFGSFFVLGNHDLRISQAGLVRHRLAANGFVDLGGRWIVDTPRGFPVVLAGNELPWFAPAAPLERCPKELDGKRLPRIVVSHSPDQFTWARSYDADLMLAGHTHGGQIRLPWIGPLVAPSRFGVKYAAGEFFESPTLLHVSRGLSSLQPLRFGCPPEISLLVLTSPGSLP